MVKIGRYFFLLTVILFNLVTVNLAHAEVKVRAYADRKQMGMGDTIDVVVQVSSSESVDASEPEFGDLKDFDILNSWTSSSTSSRLTQGQNGMEFQTQRQVEFHYMMTPKRSGQLQVPGFQVSIDNKTYKTEAFQIQVSKQGSGATQVPQGRNAMDDMDEAEQMFNQLLQRQARPNLPQPQVAPKNPNEAFFVHVDLDKKEVYEGEQITANWYLYSRGNILSLDRLKFPDLKGFWKEIIEEVPALSFTQEIINGVAYRRALLASHALFPIKSGVAVVDEYKIKASVQLPTSQFGVYGFGQPYTYTRSSDRIKITVKPLPIEGRPQSFSGAVGDFDVTAQVDHQDVSINQPFSLKIRFEGQGNAKLIELPGLELTKGLETYEVKSDAKFFKNGRSYKEFEVVLIPREPGDMKIPELTVSLFNPQTGKYYIKKTNEIFMKVTGSAVADKQQQNSVGLIDQKEKKSTIDDLKLPPIATELQAKALIFSIHESNQGLFLLILVLIVLFALLFKAKKELSHRQRRSSLQALLNKRMKSVWKSHKSGQWRETAVHMSNTINIILGQIAGEVGASTEIRSLLEKLPPSLRREIGTDLEKIVDIFQLISFAPESAIEGLKESSILKQHIEKAEALLRKSLTYVSEKEAIEKDSKAEFVRV